MNYEYKSLNSIIGVVMSAIYLRHFLIVVPKKYSYIETISKWIFLYESGRKSL